MSEAFSFDYEQDLKHAEIAGLSSEILNVIIPRWFKHALVFEQMLDNIQKSATDEKSDTDQIDEDSVKNNFFADVDSTYISHDYQFADLTSHRLRLVPSALIPPQPLNNGFDVKEIIINAPDAFIEDPATLQHFETVFITLISTDKTENRISFAVSSKDIMPFNDQLPFEIDLQYEDGKPIPIIVYKSSEDTFDTTINLFSVDEKLTTLRTLYHLIKTYRIGNQSRNDGTM